LSPLQLSIRRSVWDSVPHSAREMEIEGASDLAAEENICITLSSKLSPPRKLIKTPG